MVAHIQKVIELTFIGNQKKSCNVVNPVNPMINLLQYVALGDGLYKHLQSIYSNIRTVYYFLIGFTWVYHCFRMSSIRSALFGGKGKDKGPSHHITSRLLAAECKGRL